MVKSLGVMLGRGWGWRRLLQGAVEGRWRNSSPRCSARGRGVLLVFQFLFFVPLKPHQLPAPHRTCESHQFPHPPPHRRGPRYTPPRSVHPSSFATWSRAQGSESSPWVTPFCHEGVHSLEHHSPHHPPVFISPFLGARPRGRQARLWRGGVQLYEWGPQLCAGPGLASLG